jgi:hypothetical protein
MKKKSKFIQHVVTDAKKKKLHAATQTSESLSFLNNNNKNTNKNKSNETNRNSLVNLCVFLFLSGLHDKFAKLRFIVRTTIRNIQRVNICSVIEVAKQKCVGISLSNIQSIFQGVGSGAKYFHQILVSGSDHFLGLVRVKVA